MRNKLIYHIIRLLKGEREALDYAIDMQMKAMRKKSEMEFFYWHKKIAKDDTKQD